MTFGEVWAALGGPELRHGRARAFWRAGKDLNVSVDFEKGVFFDFVTHEGGGKVKLASLVLGVDEEGAKRWLAERDGRTYRAPSAQSVDRAKCLEVLRSADIRWQRRAGFPWAARFYLDNPMSAQVALLEDLERSGVSERIVAEDKHETEELTTLITACIDTYLELESREVAA